LIIHHPDVNDVAVFGIPDDDWGERIMAVIEPKPGVDQCEALRDSINEYARKHMAAYKVPRIIEFTDELPRQPSGKLYKRLLRDEYWKDVGRKI